MLLVIGVATLGYFAFWAGVIDKLGECQCADGTKRKRIMGIMQRLEEVCPQACESRGGWSAITSGTPMKTPDAGSLVFKR